MMKKHIVTALSCAMLSFGLMAQEDMNVQWNKKYDHQTEMVGTGLEGPNELSYISTDKGITVFKTSDGSVVWTKRFKDITENLRKIDEFVPFWESDCLFLIKNWVRIN